jgi:hypothetical protein
MAQKITGFTAGDLLQAIASLGLHCHRLGGDGLNVRRAAADQAELRFLLDGVEKAAGDLVVDGGCIVEVDRVAQHHLDAGSREAQAAVRMERARGAGTERLGDLAALSFHLVAILVEDRLHHFLQPLLDVLVVPFRRDGERDLVPDKVGPGDLLVESSGRLEDDGV